MSDDQLAEDIGLAKHVARKVWLALRVPLGLELEELEGDALLALVGAREAWRELGSEARVNFGDRNAFLWIVVRRDLVDMVRAREGRRFKRARFRVQMISLQRRSAHTDSRKDASRTVADDVPDRRLDTHSQALARIDILGFDPRQMDVSPGSGYRPALKGNWWWKNKEEAMSRWGGTGISERERECLWHLANGKGRDQAAAAMGVSIETIKTFTRKAYARLGAHNCAHAVHLAHTLGVFEGLIEATPEEESAAA